MLEELNRAPPLPYIPPPDYTIKRNHPAAQRSSRTPQYSAIFQSDSKQFPAMRNKDDPGKPHRYVPPISPVNFNAFCKFFNGHIKTYKHLNVPLHVTFWNVKNYFNSTNVNDFTL